MRATAVLNVCVLEERRDSVARLELGAPPCSVCAWRHTQTKVLIGDAVKASLVSRRSENDRV